MGTKTAGETDSAVRLGTLDDWREGKAKDTEPPTTKKPGPTRDGTKERARGAAESASDNANSGETEVAAGSVESTIEEPAKKKYRNGTPVR
jgi:hypothetical protein